MELNWLLLCEAQTCRSRRSVRVLTLLVCGFVAGIVLGAPAPSIGVELALAEPEDTATEGTKPEDTEQPEPAEERRSRKRYFAIDPGIVGGEEAESKLCQIGFALQSYHDANGHFPAPVVLGPDGRTPHSWRVALLPYLDREDIYERYRLNEPWDSAHNKRVIAAGAEVYNALPGAGPGNCSYFVFSGPGSVFDPEQPPSKIRSVQDGSVGTLAVVEAQRSIPWTKPEDLEFKTEGSLPKVGGVFPRGFHMVAISGLVYFLPADTDEITLRALISKHGEEMIDWDYDHNRVGILRDEASAETERGTTGSTPGSDKTPAYEPDEDLAGLSKEELLKKRLEAIRNSSMHRLKTIGLALYSYQQVNKHFPPAVLIGPDGKTPHSWRVALLPYLDRADLYKRYRFEEPWDSPHNKEIIAEGTELFGMSSAKKSDCCYFVLTGPGSTFDPKQPPSKFFSLRDGSRNTLAVVEARRAIPWTKPEDLNFTVDGPLPQFGGYFKDGFSVLFADTSVRFLPSDTDEVILRALISKNGKEPIEWDDKAGRARLGNAKK